MNKNILTSIDKALQATAEEIASPITASVLRELGGDKKKFPPEVYREKRLEVFVDTTIDVILNGRSVGSEKSIETLGELQEKFDGVIAEMEGVSTSASQADYRKQSNLVRKEVSETGKVPEDFSIKPLEHFQENYRLARSALNDRLGAITSQAVVLASPIRATALRLIAEDAKKLEEKERTTATAYAITFVPSTLLRAHWLILIRYSQPITKPGAVTSPRAMLAGIVTI